MNFIYVTLFLLIFPPFLTAQEFSDAVQTNLEQKDYTHAFEAARRDAQRGNPKAMGDLGLMYEKGLGTAPDDKKAASWLTQAALKGDADSENNLGYLYFNGHGVAQDYAQ